MHKCYKIEKSNTSYLNLQLFNNVYTKDNTQDIRCSN